MRIVREMLGEYVCGIDLARKVLYVNSFGFDMVCKIVYPYVNMLPQFGFEHVLAISSALLFSTCSVVGFLRVGSHYQ